MNQLIDLLKEQTIESHHWINKLIKDIEHDKWLMTPEIIETNFAWQLGHLTLSQYFYTVVLINEPHKEFAQKINIKKYSSLFSNGLKRKELLSEISINEILNNWDLMQKQTLETINNLNDADLSSEIYQMPKPHPFVKTKANSISWNIKHNMWHCGQMATLKRIVDKPLDLGM